MMWIDLANAFVVGSIVTAILWAVFFSIRKSAGLNFAYGTELFSILVALNLAAGLGWFDIAAILKIELSRTVHVLLCVALSILVFLTAGFSARWEKQAQDAFAKLSNAPGAGVRASVASVNERTALYIAYGNTLARVTVCRWVLLNLHLMWVLKIPKTLAPLTL